MAVTKRNEPPPNVLYDEPMSAHTSWRVGGPADVFYKPATVMDLAKFLRELPPQVPVHWVGLGSNTLVRDGGIRGAVICTTVLERTIERVDSRRVRVTAGVPCTAFARQCVRYKLGPAAFFAGIPGSLGGALAMNAGAFGGTTWNHVEQVETIDRHGTIQKRAQTDYNVGYRSVAGPTDEWFVAAIFHLEPDAAAQLSDIGQMVKQRGNTQPIGQPSCGSVFRNPPNDFAGRLIEAAGLKGLRIGGAVVSTKHANFILNDRQARAADIEALIEHIRMSVLERSGIELELEVRVIGVEVQS
jgi:UDP-N-acetylmuramate dehydrogenase